MGPIERRSWSRALRRALLASLLAPLLVASGCASMDVVLAQKMHGQRFVDGKQPVAHIRASNWGWYLFKFIPICTGNLEEPSYPQVGRLFTDNVNVEDVVARVTEEGKRLGGNVTTDLQTTDKSAWYYATLFFWLNEIEVSANISKD
jgi:hypothetical protein